MLSSSITYIVPISLRPKPIPSPSRMPTTLPSLAPTFIPSGVCEQGKGRLTISAENADEIEWEVQDIFGRSLISSSHEGIAASERGIISHVQQCIDWNSCYAFSFRNLADHHGVLYTVKFDDEVIVSGDFTFGNHTTMFGNYCLDNGDSVCTLSSSSSSSNESTPMSMFRLELAAEGTGRNMAWKLRNGTQHEVRAAGPFETCQVDTLALCLPRMDCYEFTITNNSGDKGTYAVMFSHVNEDMVQNYTGTAIDTTRVFLGTCYDMNFSG